MLFSIAFLATGSSLFIFVFMKQTIANVIQYFFGVNELASLPIDQLLAAQVETPYNPILPLLEILHPATKEQEKWVKSDIYANNLLWWQFVALYMNDNEDKIEKTLEQQYIEEKPVSVIKEEQNNDESLKKEIPNQTNVLETKETAAPSVEHNNVWIDLEPYHTIDYFASQGIKIDTNIEAKDKLAKQLKSFTAWLKTMKRIGPTPENLLISDETEQEVVTKAAHSIAKDEIITETMAEVLKKQGKIYKAIEIYKQLADIYPEKSVYFATKIKELVSK